MKNKAVRSVGIGLLTTGIAIIIIAAFLLVDKSKLPLALRGLKKVLGNAAPAEPGDAPPVPAWKRWLAFALILVAFLLAVI